MEFVQMQMVQCTLNNVQYNNNEIVSYYEMNYEICSLDPLQIIIMYVQYLTHF